ncbi:MAG: hypothetical protein J6T34_00275 [Bacilli bacterium]|nr:hypothetical protein [Bacilli bacterium]
MYSQHFYLARIYHNRNKIEFKYRPVLILSEKNDYVKCLGLTSQLVDSGPELMNRIDYLCSNNKHSQIRLDKSYLVKQNNLIKDLGVCNSEDFSYILQRKEKYDRTVKEMIKNEECVY